jgi:hypothetical protein
MDPNSLETLPSLALTISHMEAPDRDLKLIAAVMTAIKHFLKQAEKTRV